MEYSLSLNQMDLVIALVKAIDSNTVNTIQKAYKFNSDWETNSGASIDRSLVSTIYTRTIFNKHTS